MMEGSISDFKEKTCCHSFGVPIRNEATIDSIFNEIITEKKKGVGSFLLQIIPA